MIAKRLQHWKKGVQMAIGIDRVDQSAKRKKRKKMQCVFWYVRVRAFVFLRKWLGK